MRGGWQLTRGPDGRFTATPAGQPTGPIATDLGRLRPDPARNHRARWVHGARPATATTVPAADMGPGMHASRCCRNPGREPLLGTSRPLPPPIEPCPRR